MLFFILCGGIQYIPCVERYFAIARVLLPLRLWLHPWRGRGWDLEADVGREDLLLENYAVSDVVGVGWDDRGRWLGELGGGGGGDFAVAAVGVAAFHHACDPNKRFLD